MDNSNQFVRWVEMRMDGSRENNCMILRLAALPSSAKRPSAKTTQQIIRESVRNMSIPPTNPPVPSTSTPPTPKSGEGKETTATKGKRKVQRHSAGTIDYDNVEAGGITDPRQTTTANPRENSFSPTSDSQLQQGHLCVYTRIVYRYGHSKRKIERHKNYI